MHEIYGVKIRNNSSKPPQHYKQTLVASFHVVIGEKKHTKIRQFHQKYKNIIFLERNYTKISDNSILKKSSSDFLFSKEAPTLHTENDTICIW
jgi:hypothetical protein